MTGQEYRDQIDLLNLMEQVACMQDGNRTYAVVSALVQHICTTLWANDVLVNKAFRCFDKEATGALTPDDFRTALATANAELARPHTPLTKNQIDQLVEALPLDDKAKINYNEFMGAFEAVDTTHYERTYTA